MSLIADYGLVLLLLACLFGFFMAWGVGANDVANAMGTSVGSQALKAMNELDELLETGFGGREAALVGSMVEELEQIERDTDLMQIDVRRALFKLEKDLPPVDVMFLYQIIEWIGDVADRAERVGNRLEQLLAR
jgi:predicted phosphate transport protein (TIGR00153 family)